MSSSSDASQKALVQLANDLEAAAAVVSTAKIESVAMIDVRASVQHTVQLLRDQDPEGIFILDSLSEQQEIPTALFSSGSSLVRRFKTSGGANMSTLQKAWFILVTALHLVSEDIVDLSRFWNAPAAVLVLQFKALGDYSLLDPAIKLQRHAVTLAPPGHPTRAKILNHLAISLRCLYDKDQDENLLSETISIHEEALELRPVGHPERSFSLNNLATALRRMFEIHEDKDLLQKIIDLQRQTIGLVPKRDFPRSMALYNLATSLSRYSEIYGDAPSLREAVLHYKEAIELRPMESPARAEAIRGLALCFRLLFQHSYEIPHIEEAISLFREATKWYSPGHKDKINRMNDLGIALTDLVRKTGNEDSCREAISIYEEVLQMPSLDLSERYMTLNRLASVIYLRAERSNSIADIRYTIQLHREALSLYQKGDKRRDLTLNNLGIALNLYFNNTRDMTALVESIALLREALDLSNHDHPERDVTLDNLPLSLITHFQQTGDPASLYEAITLLREALRLHPPGHHRRSKSLNNLALALLTQYEQLGDLNALSESISHLRDALLLRPTGHPMRRSSLNNLAIALECRYQLTKDGTTISDNIRLLREAVEICPEGHMGRPTYLANLANNLALYCQHHKDMSYINESLTILEQVLSCYDPSHPQYLETLRNLTGAYSTKLFIEYDPATLSTLLKLQRKVINLYQEGHPGRCKQLHRMARTQLRFCHSGHWSEALQFLLQANQEVNTPARSRLRMILDSLSLVDWAIGIRFRERVLELYVQALRLLPRVAHFGLDASTRLRELIGSEKICRHAASHAVILQKAETAIELLEEGRAVFWSQALHLRDDALDTLPPDDREKLSIVFRALELEPNTETGLDGFQAPNNLEKEIESRRKLNIQAEQLISKIRSRPGFDRFLMIPPFRDLTRATTRGPVVILLATDFICSAIILSNEAESAQIIKLPDINPERLKKMRVSVSATGMRDQNVSLHPCEPTDVDLCSEGIETTRPMGFEKPKKRTVRVSEAEAVLAEIWRTINDPIIKALNLEVYKSGKRLRLHWCPTGDFAFLPLHAAGIYTGDAQCCMSDFAVSSYTPTLSALIKSRNGWSAVDREQLKALLIAEPGPLGPGHIEKVKEEVCAVAKLIEGGSGTVLNDPKTTPELPTILNQISAAHLLHIACHGQQNPDPLKSQFVLQGEALTIAQLMKLKLPNATFAFLSACETAKGDENQPDQAVHLAASVLFCGFRSVIATMWSMNDMDGPTVARLVYKKIFEKETFDLDDIPFALDAAVRELRNQGVPPSRWATFVHIGA